MNTVYVVTEGEYSDYRILAVFSDQATAEALAASTGYPERGVEEWDLLGPDTQVLTKLTMTVEVVRTEHDAIVERYASERTEPVLGEAWNSYMSGWPKLSSINPPRVSVVVEGTDHDRVRKVYSERRARAVAEFALLTAKHANYH